jgi:hypothetical protein
MKGEFRYYEIEGMSLPSVTSILGNYLPEEEGLRRWKERTDNADAVMNRSAAIGTLVHYRIASYFAAKYHTAPVMLDLKGYQMTEEMVDTANLIMSYFDDFVQKYDVVADAIEFTIWHRKALFAGTADLRGYIDKQYTVIDWKTSSGIYPKHRAQAWAYKRAIQSDPKWRHKIDQLAIVNLNAKRGLTVEIVDEVEAEALWWEAFENYQIATRPKERWIKREEL